MRLIWNKHTLNHNTAPFTTNQISIALKASENNTALSHNSLAILQLKYLGSFGLRSLTRTWTHPCSPEAFHLHAFAKAWQAEGAGSLILADISPVPYL